VGVRKVLITGATGFVGTHVATRLAEQGVSIRALVRESSDTRRLAKLDAELAPGSLTSPDSLRKAVHGVDAVVHLAALTHARSATEYHRVNEAGTRELIRAAVETSPRPGRFVYLSSLAAAGPSIDGRPVEPEDEPRPLSAYGRSKLAGEAACTESRDEMSMFVLRAPAVYGPGDREMFRFFRMAKLGVVPIPAGAARKVQLVHVADLAEAITRATLEPAEGGVFHIAESRAYDSGEFARHVAEAVGTRAWVVGVPPMLVRMAGRVSELAYGILGRSSVFNREKATELLAPGWLCETGTARRALGFEAEIPLPRGLAETARWYEENRWL